MSTPTHYATSLSDEQWHVLHLMLPEPKWQPGGPGRPPLDLRRVVDGIFYVNKTGVRDHRGCSPVSNYLSKDCKFAHF